MQPDRVPVRGNGVARILVIDDSSFQRKILTTLFEGSGHEILFATNGREGFIAAESNHPDLIITDLLMPDTDGFAFLRKTASAGIRSPILILTSDIQTATRDRCLALGAAGVMNKPAKKEDLTATVNRVLGTGKV